MGVQVGKGTGWKACPTADGVQVGKGQAGKPVLQTDALQVAVGGAEDVVQLADDVVGQRIDLRPSKMARTCSRAAE